MTLNFLSFVSTFQVLGLQYWHTHYSTLAEDGGGWLRMAEALYVLGQQLATELHLVPQGQLH